VDVFGAHLVHQREVRHEEVHEAPNADGSVTIVISRGMTAHPNSVTTLDYPRGNLAFRWFLAEEVPARPQVRVVPVSEAPVS
jgi:hypothetical protein